MAARIDPTQIKGLETLIVRQTASPIRRPKDQLATLVGLGLGKLGRERELKVTLPMLGMVAKVAHLVEARAPKPAKDGSAQVLHREDVQAAMALLRAEAQAQA